MDLFGDPVKSPKHSLSPIGTIGEVITGTTPSMKKDEYYDSKDIMFIKPSKIEVNRDRRKFCVIDVPRQYENLRLSQE